MSTSDVVVTGRGGVVDAPDLRGVARGDAMTGWSGQDIWRAADQGNTRP